MNFTKKFSVMSGAFIVIASLASLSSGLLEAQDVMKVGSKNYKLLLENSDVRVMEARFAAGDSIGTHSHPKHFVYVLKDGELTLTTPDGKSKKLEAKTGEVIWGEPETHSTKNTGGTEAKLLVVELKGTK